MLIDRILSKKAFAMLEVLLAALDRNLRDRNEETADQLLVS